MATAGTTAHQQELQEFVDSLVDALVPQPAKIIDLRMEPRQVGSIPVLVIPIEEGALDVAQSMFVVTRNLSSTGAALISQSRLPTEEVILGLWDNKECRFVTAAIHYQMPIEGGFSQIGVELLRLVRSHEFPALNRLSQLANRLTANLQ